MSTMVGRPDVALAVGTEFRSVPRRMTRERMRWYVDALPTAAADDGLIHSGAGTIHDDDDYAKKQGLTGIISDGMISTNWIAGLLYDAFGRDFLSGGALTTKYIAPIYEDELVIVRAKVTAREVIGDRWRYSLDVSCDDGAGKIQTVGTALVTSSR